MGSPNLIGSRIADRYEIIALAGAGGMGLVYRALQLDLDRFVAVKLLDQGLVSDEEMFARFQMEAKALSKLSHQNIGGFYSFGVLESGMPYIVMEFLEGKRLRSLIDEAPLAVERAIHIALQIAAGMQYAHSSGIVHRDLKPDNVILLSIPEPDFVKIVDFGLAKHADLGNAQSYTMTGDLVGTPQYLSPEQCRGQRVIDARSDVYALGCLMYEMLFGNPPFDADAPMGIVYKHLNESVQFPEPALRNEPLKSFCQIIKRCMERDPKDRYQSMEDLSSDLNLLKENQYAKLSEYAKFSEHAGGSIDRKPLIFTLILCVAMIAFLGVAFVAYNSSKDPAVSRGDSLTSTAKLVELIKSAAKQKDTAEKERLVRILKERTISEASRFDKGPALYDVAVQFQALPDIANEFAISAIVETLNRSNLYTNRVGRFAKALEARGVDGLSLVVVPKQILTKRQSVSEQRGDPGQLLKSAALVDKASQLLLSNGFFADKALIAKLMHLNRLTDTESSYQLASFNTLILQSAEKAHLPPSDMLLALYRRQAGFLIYTDTKAERRSLRNRYVELSKKLHGADSVMVAQAYLDSLDMKSAEQDPLPVIEEVAKLARRHPKDPSWSPIYSRVISLYLSRDDWAQKAVEFANDGLALESSDLTRAALLGMRGDAYAAQGKYTLALDDQKHAFAVIDSWQVEQERMSIVSSIARTLRMKGDKDEAEKFLLKEESRSESLGYLDYAGNVYTQLGLNAKTDKDYPKALLYYRKCVAIYTKVSNINAAADMESEILQVQNLSDSADNKGLQQYLKALKAAPITWVCSSVRSDHWDVVSNGFKRYKEKNLQKEIAESKELFCDLTETVTDNRFPHAVENLRGVLEVAQSCGASSPRVSKEIERLKLFNAK